MDEEFNEAGMEDLMDFINSLPEEQKSQLQELLNVLVYELFTTTTKDNDVVFCGSNGVSVINCLGADRAALGEDGPVILPSSNESVILFAVAHEFLQEQVESYTNMYPDPELRELEWQKFFDSLAGAAAQLHENAATPIWEKLLDG